MVSEVRDTSTPWSWEDRAEEKKGGGMCLRKWRRVEIQNTESEEKKLVLRQADGLVWKEGRRRMVICPRPNTLTLNARPAARLNDQVGKYHARFGIRQGDKPNSKHKGTRCV